ncbi:hypothetical protein FNV43_RR04208 [Rhamnella rubrinervis]|uniref:Uncharacterized protein n=1 Tax=Rhamnella rubrinervis TaxID=2594499 RepID=A0A8K0HJ54_9ROSA|nr:hypothetical protein FNV43_RR04208 [Rhamnella rubrinervis]
MWRSEEVVDYRRKLWERPRKLPGGRGSCPAAKVGEKLAKGRTGCPETAGRCPEVVRKLPVAARVREAVGSCLKAARLSGGRGSYLVVRKSASVRGKLPEKEDAWRSEEVAQAVGRCSVQEDVAVARVAWRPHGYLVVVRVLTKCREEVAWRTVRKMPEAVRSLPGGRREAV